MAKTVKFGGNPMELEGTETKVGQKAYDFTCVGGDLKPVKFSDTRGKVRILSVFPSIDTPVCSRQAARFNQEAGKLGDKVALYAISNDLPFAQGRYCAAEGVKNLRMVSDYKDLDFSRHYGFLMPALRLLARGVVVVDAHDVVQYVEYVPEVTHEPNFEAALEAVKKLL